MLSNRNIKLLRNSCKPGVVSLQCTLKNMIYLKHRNRTDFENLANVNHFYYLMKRKQTFWRTFFVIWEVFLQEKKNNKLLDNFSAKTFIKLYPNFSNY